jgi:LysR family glycine cleavage system transcriptional activator
MRMPPLSLLRTFEVAARRGSFKGAAEELHITPAAVSQQMRTLEELLDVTLFRREVRAVVLTDIGQEYLLGVSDGLLRVQEATLKLRGPLLAGELKITTVPSFAQYWLISRLKVFRARYPSIDIMVDASSNVLDLHHEEADLAIRFGHGRYQGLVSTLLMTDTIFPVCTPVLLGGRHHAELGDLLRYPLIHDVGAGEAEPWAHWAPWLRELDTSVQPDSGHLKFGDTSLALSATRSSQGVMLGRASVVSDLLAVGELVRPVPEAVRETDFAYFILTTETAAAIPRIRAFREWLLEEAQR